MPTTRRRRTRERRPDHTPAQLAALEGGPCPEGCDGWEWLAAQCLAAQERARLRPEDFEPEVLKPNRP